MDLTNFLKAVVTESDCYSVRVHSSNLIDALRNCSEAGGDRGGGGYRGGGTGASGGSTDCSHGGPWLVVLLLLFAMTVAVLSLQLILLYQFHLRRRPVQPGAEGGEADYTNRLSWDTTWEPTPAPAGAQ